MQLGIRNARASGIRPTYLTIALVFVILSVYFVSSTSRRRRLSHRHSGQRSSDRDLEEEDVGGSDDDDQIQDTDGNTGKRISNKEGLYRTGKYICLEDEDDRDRLAQFHQKKEMHCKCPKMYAPVCGNDGNTYHNRCFMQCYSDFKYQGFSRDNVKLEVVKWGPCDEEHEMQPQMD